MRQRMITNARSRAGNAVLGDFFRFTLWLLLFCSPFLYAQTGNTGNADPRYTVLSPSGYPPPIERKSMAPRPADLSGKTIFFVDITFNNGDVLLREMQQWLAANRPDIKTEFRVKTGLYATDDPELWKEIQAAGGLMIMAIGH